MKEHAFWLFAVDRARRRRIFAFSAAGMVIGVLMFRVVAPIFAAPPASPYQPGETLNPSCAPGDTNCTVSPPIFGSGTSTQLAFWDSSSSIVSSPDLTYASSTRVFSVNATSTFFGRVGIDTAQPSSTLHVIGTSVFAGGRVGIGTTTPATILSIASSAPIISLTNTAGGGQQYQIRNGVAGVSMLDIFDPALNASRFLIDGSGRISLGSTTPPSEAKMFVYGGPSGANVDIRAATNLETATVEVQADDYATSFQSAFLQYVGSGIGGTIFSGIPNADLAALAFQGPANALIYTSNASPLIFATDFAERMRITASGAVGIGTNAPSTTLHVAGTSRFSATSTFLGNVGIGTTTPATTLHVIGTTTLGTLTGLLKGTSGVVGTAAAGTDYPAVSEPYLVVSNTAGLSAERALSAGSNIVLTDGGANSALTVGVTTTPSFASLALTNPLGYASGGTATTTSFAQGSVIFSGPSSFAQDNANFFWDNANARLGVGTSTPATLFSVATSSNIFNVMSGGRVGIGTANPSSTLHAVNVAAAQALFSGWDEVSGVAGASGQLLIGTAASFQGRIHYNGGANANLYIDNSFDSTAASQGNIYLRTRTAGASPATALTIAPDGTMISSRVASSGIGDPAVRIAGYTSFGVYSVGLGFSAFAIAPPGEIGFLETNNQGSTLGDLFFATRATTTAVAATERMRITASGAVGIGTTSPSSTLHVVGSSTFAGRVSITGANSLAIATSTPYGATTTLTVCALSNCTKPAAATSTNTVAFFASTGGATTDSSIVTRGTIASGQADIGEYIEVVGDPADYRAGDVLSIATVSPRAFEKSKAAYDPLLAGVVTETAGFIAGGGEDGHGSVVIALAGRVPVRISGESGPIKIGDPLTASSERGVAMRATAPGRVVGISLENFPRTEPAASSSLPLAENMIVMLVNPGFSVGALDEHGEIAGVEADLGGSVGKTFVSAVRFALARLGITLREGVATLQEVFADRVTTKQLCLEDVCVGKDELKSLLGGSSPALVPPPPLSPVESSEPSSSEAGEPPAGGEPAGAPAVPSEGGSALDGSEPEPPAVSEVEPPDTPREKEPAPVAEPAAGE